MILHPSTWFTRTLTASQSLPSPNGSWQPCNGSPGNCLLSLDRYTFPGTHNSVATQLPASCYFVDQPDHPISKQLADGIRSFDIDTCESDGDVWACHWPFIAGRITDHLHTIREFLDSNPREIVAISYDDANGDLGIIADTVWKDLQEILGDMLTPRPIDRKSPWPTMGNMLANGHRVVVPLLKEERRLQFIDDSYQKSWPHAAKDALSTRQFVQDFSVYCESPEGQKGTQTIDLEFEPVGTCISDIAPYMNHEPLVYLALHCGARFQHTHRVRVDHYWDSDVIPVARALNAFNLLQLKRNMTVHEGEGTLHYLLELETGREFRPHPPFLRFGQGSGWVGVVGLEFLLAFFWGLMICYVHAKSRYSPMSNGSSSFNRHRP
ncbi:MAG: PLC-like phosphodiesterase [Piptocephalis tieghemiana]|nr:MAG: PLC-like phosphodiesterase [Piptocephalis tieghemiana]